MPELPEIETVRRTLRSALVGRQIAEAEVTEDAKVFEGRTPNEIRDLLVGRRVTEVGRRGKYWWLEFADRPWLGGHLGMAGLIREIGEKPLQLREIGSQPLDDSEGRPRFLKFLLTTDEGRRIAFTDMRRFARFWAFEDPATDKTLRALGRDAYEDLPTAEEIQAMLAKRSAPMKALLLDQKLFCGIGNYLADEILYQARLSPHREGGSLIFEEVERLRAATVSILDHAVRVSADYEHFPASWIFHVRWGGGKGEEFHEGQALRRETVGGRTTAWVPAVQK